DNKMMMDPELIKLAQEQISRMSPSELASIQQQMMSNPELMKMASESMKNMRPEDLREAAEQLKNVRSEDMAEIGKKMATASPEEIASIRTRAEAQITYELNAAEILKKQGNQLHGQGKFKDALQKYLLAKKNLKGIPSSKGRPLMLACSLNLMSCYLKTRQYDECINEGSELWPNYILLYCLSKVLAYDAENVKALYRRGQAYKELGRLQDAVSDLCKAHAVSPNDGTIADVLRDAEEKLQKYDEEKNVSRGVVIEEITEDEDTVTSDGNKGSSVEHPVMQDHEKKGQPKSQSLTSNGVPKSESECLQALKDDPESVRSFQNFFSNADPSMLAAMGGGKVGEISPDMMKTASKMISKMSPEELQNMLQMASSLQGQNPYSAGGSSGTNSKGFGSGFVPPTMTPNMLKTASNMMSKMSPEDLQRIFEMASSMKGNESIQKASSSNGSMLNSETSSGFPGIQEDSTAVRSHATSEISSSHGMYPSSRGVATQPSNFPTPTADLQEQMRNQMKDPAMRQMFTSMMKNMSPEMMANMGEQFGFKLSREDAEKAQQAMSSLSPEQLDAMLRWADRAQRAVETAKKSKNWLLGKPGMILAICMLILAMILHRLGFIGS
ncbi:hypothetical protein RJ641_008202, partial [Dillenia turbinata]